MEKQQKSEARSNQENEEPQTIVLGGNLADGFKAVGPFVNWASAQEWAESQPDYEWVLIDLEPSEEEVSDGG